MYIHYLIQHFILCPIYPQFGHRLTPFQIPHLIDTYYPLLLFLQKIHFQIDQNLLSYTLNFLFILDCLFSQILEHVTQYHFEI